MANSSKFDFNQEKQQRTQPEQSQGADQAPIDDEDFEREATEQEERAIQGREKYQPNKKENNVTTEFPPLKASWTSLKDNLTLRPPSPEWLCDELIRLGDVGMIAAAGGTGKSFLVFQLGAALARGEKFGIFVPVGKIPTLILFAEDNQNIVNERGWVIKGDRDFPEGLHVASICGEVGPILELKNGNPARSQWFGWLDQTIENHPDIKCLILDPKSRLFGLSENDNGHNTEFVAALEYLAKKYHITILFTHHTSKLANSKDGSTQGMSRGGSSLEDGVRFAAGMTPMSEKEARALGVVHSDYITLSVYKLNYAKNPGKAYFQRGENGVLIPTNIKSDHFWNLGKTLAEILKADGGNYSRRDLTQDKKHCKNVWIGMEEQFSQTLRLADMASAIDAGTKAGLLMEVPGERPGPGVIKKVLKIRSDILLPGETRSDDSCVWMDGAEDTIPVQ
ncbi:MAG: AAA family ATPase [Deltaproteobacteria bacterium]|nr:AAA family ATPase [Deltaproteobacteria bacterium]